MHNSVQLLFLSASIVLRFLSSGKVGLIGYLLPIIFLLILTKHISQSSGKSDISQSSGKSEYLRNFKFTTKNGRRSYLMARSVAAPHRCLLSPTTFSFWWVRKGDTSPSDRSCMSTRNRISSISSQSFSLEQREYRIHNHEPSTEFYSDYKRTTYLL